MKHVVRNALIPVVTPRSAQTLTVFGGAIVTEQIFRIPGIGSLLIDAILRNDTVSCVTFVVACLVILFNFLADLIYGWLDPRISYRGRPGMLRASSSRYGARRGDASAAIAWRW